MIYMYSEIPAPEWHNMYSEIPVPQTKEEFLNLEKQVIRIIEHIGITVDLLWEKPFFPWFYNYNRSKLTEELIQFNEKIKALCDSMLPLENISWRDEIYFDRRKFILQTTVEEIEKLFQKIHWEDQD